MKRFLAILIFFLILSPGISFGNYSSVTVPIDDPVYRKLDKLAAFGLIKTMIKGQRPFVRSEIARLIAEAIENYPEFEKSYRDNPDLTLKQSKRMLSAKVHVDRTLRKLKEKYREELIQRKVLPGEVPTFQGEILEYLRADYMYLSEDKEMAPADNGMGGVNGLIQPLVSDREGRHYQNGSNWSFETSHWVRLGKYFSFQAQPRFQMQIARHPHENETKVFVQRLNGRFTYGKLDIEIGRDSINWGPSSQGGLMYSSNSRPLDFIKVSSISPFHYPFFFEKLGQNQMTLLVANLGPEQTFKNPWVFAFKISNRKTEYLEFGMSHTLLIGGEGAPSVGFGEGVVGFFSPNEEAKKYYTTTAFEFNGRIPQFRGAEIYLELQFEDFSTNMHTLWVNDASYLVGFYLPRANYIGTLDIRLEYRRISPRYARSPLFTTGWTENGLFIGDRIGPDSHNVSMELFYELNPKNLLSFNFLFSRRFNTLYQWEGSSVKTVANLGSQDRFLYRFGWRRIFNKHLVARVGLGLEQVHNVNFVSGDDSFNWFGEAGFTVFMKPQVVFP